MSNSSLGLLERIVAVKRREVARIPAFDFQKLEAPPSFPDALRRKPGEPLRVIAECKKASPSKGLLCENYQPDRIAIEYARLGAGAVSVLTDREFFQGAPEHLTLAAAAGLPLLRKDFIISEKQIYEACALGASAVLLIVRLLSAAELASYITLARDLQMEVLVEIHDERELETALQSGAGIIGINHRDLDTLVIDLELTPRLAPRIRRERPQVIIIAESGVESREGRLAVDDYVDAVLIGTALVGSADREATWREIFS